jgi:hypothetical protein
MEQTGFTKLLQKQVLKATNDGIVLGMKHIKKALNDFINNKKNDNEIIKLTQEEINFFIDEYVSLYVKTLENK